MLVLFPSILQVSNRMNYSLEAFNLLAQYHFLLSPRMAMQLLWNCTVNIHGYPGMNVPCDLRMEHLNHEAKNSITGLGSNITDDSVIRIRRSIGHNVKVLNSFDRINQMKKVSSHHSKHSSKKDMGIILKLYCHEFMESGEDCKLT